MRKESDRRQAPRRAGDPFLIKEDPATLNDPLAPKPGLTRSQLLRMFVDLEQEHGVVEQVRREWTQVFDAINDPIFVHDAQYRIVRANRAYAERAGGDFSTILGRPYWEVFPRRSGPLPNCRVDAEGMGDNLSEEFVTRQGETFVSRTFVMRDSHADFLYAVHVLEDVTEQRRVEMERRLMSEAMRQSAAGLVLLNTDMSFRYANPAACNLVGYKPGELENLPLSTVTPGKMTGAMRRLKDEVDSAGRWTGEIRLATKDSDLIPVYLSAAVVTDDKGHVTAYVGSWLDLRPIRQAQEALAASEARFRLLTEYSSDLVAVVSADGILRYVSESILRFLGVGHDDVIGHPMRNFLHPDEVHEAEAILAASIANPNAMPAMTHRLRNKDGTWRYFETLGRNLLYEPAVAGIVLNSHDITEHKLAQERLQESEATLRKERDTAQRYLDVAGVILVALDTNGQVTLINRKGCELLGYREEEIVGRPWFERFLPEQSRQETLKVFEQIMQGETQLTEFHENPILSRDSGERFIAWHNRILTDEAGKITGILSSGEDITARKQMEDTLIRRNRALKALTACDAVLIHAESESELLEKICRVIVQLGDYRLTWVAYIVPGENGLVQPMAMAGSDEGTIESFQFDWGSKEFPQRLCGHIMPDKQPVIINNIQGDPAHATLREEAGKGGYDSFVALPLNAGQGTLLGELYIYAIESNAFDEEEVRLLVEMADDLAFGITTLRTRVGHERLQQENLRNADNLKKTLTDTIRAIALTVEKRDPYTAGHQNNVAELCVAIGRELNLDQDRLEGLRLGAAIHDIGKIYVPAEILNRPGKLTVPEFEIIKTHPEVGYDIVKDVKFPWPVAQMILQHHERLDGSGYPGGLKGEEILLEARILAVADTVDAMSSHRPYRPAIGPEKALAEIEQQRGKRYDPDVVDSCLRLFREKGFHFG